MHKQKRPAPRKPVESTEDQEDALVRSLAGLALELASQDGGAKTDALKKKNGDFQRLIRKCLHQDKDDVLQEALERTQEDDPDAYLFLKDSIEEASQIIVFRRDDGPDLEVNAFVVPLFAHTSGGLLRAQCFQDEQAFDLLRRSFQEAQLESPDARVVLVSHAYHADEIERIGYSQLGAMVREAFESMTRKKATAAPQLARSMSGWPESGFAPADRAVELRFLLGFALKALDDPFYRVPQDEAAADRYFEARAARFRQWTQQAAPLLQRCLVTDGSDIHIDFLYQDLFYGGKETGIAELDMLQMLSALQHALDARGILPEQAGAVVGPAEREDETVLRIQLSAPDGAPLASADKPIGPGRDLRDETDDACDALMTIGVKSLSVARKFEADGSAVDVRPYKFA